MFVRFANTSWKPSRGALFAVKNRAVVPALAGLLLISSSSSPVHSFSTTTTTTTPTMPQPPYRYRESSPIDFDLVSIGSRINASEEKRQQAFDISRKLQFAIVGARNELELETSIATTAESLSQLQDSLNEAIGGTKTGVERKPREANLNNRVEDYVRLLAFSHFLTTGTMLPPSMCTFATDEEYLGGACMGLCQDLARYGMGRATARDVASVTAARDLVQESLEYLLKFDFRNGYLRRKYDGTKYALKTLETILYELSVTGATTTTTAADDELVVVEPDTKRTKVEAAEEPSSSKMPSPTQDELEGIRQRMEHRDELREKLIKKCRDGQKAAKQAIYALHRGDSERAQILLTQCEESITKDLLPIVTEEPPLRGGSFSNVMEEYAEAKLFYVWLLGKDETPTETSSGIILKPEDFEIALEPDEYLGGLCDLTGEIGRYAVQRGTARDFDGVKHCLEANAAIAVAIQTMERFPGKIGKKLDQLRKSVEKLERMTYEMSLSEAAGGRKVDTEEMPDPETSYND
jgi:predicted translin family RNA/ssDNA-binding protein